MKFLGTNWFYHSDSGRRVLVALVQKQTIKDIRGLAEKVAKALQSKKIKDVEFVFSSSISNINELSGHFINNFENKNYESDCKRPLEVKEGEDPRKTRHLSNVENYSVSLEDESIKDNQTYRFQLAAANSLKLSKSLAQVRGSVATPDYMWNRVKEICNNQPSIKKITVITGKELEEKGMNLFWNVGKGAAC